MRGTTVRCSAARHGFTVLEVSVSMVVLGLLAYALNQALTGMRGLSTANNVNAQLQNSAERALTQISLDLKRSGFVTVAGMDYPILFEDGAYPAPHGHPPAQKTAQPGDPDFGPNSEIIFVQPADDDGDGVPDLDADLYLIWGGTEFSYVLVTGVDGINYLQRRVDGVAPRTVASYVERIVFEDSASTGWIVEPNSIRVRIFMRKRDGVGTMHRYAAETILQLRNGVDEEQVL